MYYVWCILAIISHVLLVYYKKQRSTIINHIHSSTIRLAISISSRSSTIAAPQEYIVLVQAMID